MGHGGKRLGAGRPVGSGKYSQGTQVMRIPTEMVGRIKKFIDYQGYRLPLYSSMRCAVPANENNPSLR